MPDRSDSGPERVEPRAGLHLPRVLTGLWQMADQERDGRAYDLDAAAEALAAYARAGFDGWDMADHYGSAEIVAGRAARILCAEGRPVPTILTKWCPEPGEMDRGTVRRAVETALERLGLDRVDVMQLHWWRYGDSSYLDALQHLQALREEGLVGHLGLTNFDAAHLRLVVRDGIEVATNQICLSLIDRRGAGEMARVASDHGVALLAFGTLAGGFLSDRWIARPEPAEVGDWSRMKYRRFIAEAGGWSRFQILLAALEGVARRHGVSVPNVAARWVLDLPAVASVIVGVRLGEREHRADNARLGALSLTEDDRAELARAVGALEPIPGDCGDEYRRPPYLTASGDLSHHLDALPSSMEMEDARPGRRRASSGSVWEERAGFSRAVRVGDRILVSGTTATMPDGRCVCPGDAEGQAVFALDKVTEAVEALGGAPEDVVRTRIYMRDPASWEPVARAHARVFGTVRPANTLVGAGLVGPYEMEIEAEAVVG